MLQRYGTDCQNIKKSQYDKIQHYPERPPSHISSQEEFLTVPFILTSAPYIAADFDLQ